MNDLSSVDRQLVALLKSDSRMSITSLAAKLKTSRPTVQSRLERLIKTGVIQRFTVDVDASVNNDLIKAVMLIEIEGTLARSIIKNLKRLPEILDLHTTNGAWDLVAHIETTSLTEFDQVLRKVREIKGVLNSETSILLNKAIA